MEKQNYILLTFDVEDWFQVENFKSYIEFSTWNSFRLRVEKNTHHVLNLLDSFNFQPKATFFILGWIAKKVPGLVKEIHNRGHEVASHGFDHHLCTHLEPVQLAHDLERSKKFLEDLAGIEVSGYRAPSFAINDNIISSIQQAGYKYDSSYNSFSGHGRYGTVDLSKAQKKEGAYMLFQGFYEIPISNLNLSGKTIPLGGGGYFRLLPVRMFKWGMRRVMKHNGPFVFYAHPWEFDPNQPRVDQASKWFKFRHYINLHKTEKKLGSLLSNFPNCLFISCRQYLASLDMI